MRVKEPVNDNCEDAITVMVTPEGNFTSGSTVGATVDVAEICDDVNITAPGVW